jgi:hypothetical protein
MDRAGFIPSLDKEGWREAPGWFEAAIPQLRSDSYKTRAGCPCYLEGVIPLI